MFGLLASAGQHVIGPVELAAHAGLGEVQKVLRVIQWFAGIEGRPHPGVQAQAARYALVDLALDTLPYTGGDTTAAALASGIPVVTRIGVRHAERMAASILSHAGLPELVAADDEGYVELAVRAARDTASREHLRARVRAAFAQPALSDPAIYARALEAAYTRALTERGLLPT